MSPKCLEKRKTVCLAFSLSGTNDTTVSVVSVTVVPSNTCMSAFSCVWSCASIILSCSPSLGMNSASPRDSWLRLSRMSYISCATICAIFGRLVDERMSWLM